MLEQLLDEERRIHQEVLDDLKEEKKNYVE
jgi:hypothetical protein